MVLIRILLALLIGSAVAPAPAHKDHEKKMQEAAAAKTAAEAPALTGDSGSFAGGD